MELVQEGYKLTELGLIPGDWLLRDFGDLTEKIIGGGTPSRANKAFWGKDYPWATVKDFATFNRKTTQEYITKLGLSKSASNLIPRGILITSTRMALGKAVIYDVEVCINQDLKAIFPKKLIDTYFLYYWFEFNSKKLEELGSGSTVMGISLSDLRKLKVILPSILEEQKAIATALGDTDDLIAGLEKLIAKKKAIKQGAMQQLLTPKEDWIEINLGESSVLKARIGWQGLTTDEYLSTGNYTLITGTDFDSGYIKWENCVYVKKERYDQDPNIQVKENDVLVTKDGTIGKVAFVDKVFQPTTLNSGVFVIRPLRHKYYPLFLYHILMSKYFSDFLSKLTAGSTISHLYQKDFVHFSFKAPTSIEEQERIAFILKDMDKEIEALEAKKAKFEQVKQGMMQELFTGKTRLG